MLNVSHEKLATSLRYAFVGYSGIYEDAEQASGVGENIPLLVLRRRHYKVDTQYIFIDFARWKFGCAIIKNDQTGCLGSFFWL